MMCFLCSRIEYPRIQFRARRWCRRSHVVSQLDLWLEDCALVINRECFHTAISAAVFWTITVVRGWCCMYTAFQQPFIRIWRVSFNDNKATLIFFDIKNIERVKFKFAASLVSCNYGNGSWKKWFFRSFGCRHCGWEKNGKRKQIDRQIAI